MEAGTPVRRVYNSPGRHPSSLTSKYCPLLNETMPHVLQTPRHILPVNHFSLCLSHLSFPFLYLLKSYPADKTQFKCHISTKPSWSSQLRAISEGPAPATLCRGHSSDCLVHLSQMHCFSSISLPSTFPSRIPYTFWAGNKHPLHWIESMRGRGSCKDMFPGPLEPEITSTQHHMKQDFASYPGRWMCVDVLVCSLQYFFWHLHSFYSPHFSTSQKWPFSSHAFYCVSFPTVC